MEESEALKKSAKPTWKEFLDIAGPSFGWFGAQVAWCLQDGFATPYLLELGLTTSNVNWVWIAGPISGIFVQPIVGSYSDILKKRKPFIIGGSISMFICLLLFSNAKEIGKAMNSGELALGLAIVSFWILDISINVLMAPLRALASDTVDAAKQIYSMSWFAFFAGCAHIVGFFLGAVIPHIRIVYLVGAIIIICSCSATIFSVKNEVKANVATVLNQNMCLYGIVNIYQAFGRLPKLMMKLMHTQFWAFIAFIAMWVYLTNYYGENLMNGDVHAKEGSEPYNLYQLGVQYGNLGYTMQGIVMLIVAYISPSAADMFGMKTFWILGFLIFGCVMVSTPWINNLYVFLPLHAITGGAFAVHMVYPWTIATKYTCVNDGDNAGVILTTYHVSACVPTLIAAFVSGFIIDAFNNDVAAMLFIGGIASFIAAFTVLFNDTEYVKPAIYEAVPPMDDPYENEENLEDDGMDIEEQANM